MTIKTSDDAIRHAHAYLMAMEARDLDSAGTYMAKEHVLTFPGAAVFRSLGEIVRNSGGRYRKIGKTIEAWDAFESGGVWIVYCRGTLQGEWGDGHAFAGIRFIDRFEIGADGIRRQDVWNDSGEYRAARQG